MTDIRDWIWNEVKQIGKDYDSVEEVSVYDASHSKFRDTVSESQEILLHLGAKKGEVLLDMGCGTGVFAREASKIGLNVLAADVSDTMLEFANHKTNPEDSNIEYIKAGFLSDHYEDNFFDYVVTSFSFHHLPDFYKFIALQRIKNCLKDDGKLFIQDVVIEDGDFEDNINSLIDRQESLGGDFLREDAIQHFQEEFSTFDWVLEGMLKRAGFYVASKSMMGGLLARYTCLKS